MGLGHHVQWSRYPAKSYTATRSGSCTSVLREIDNSQEQAIPDPVDEEDSSVFTREQSPARLGTKTTFCESVKTSALNLASKFRESATLLKSLLGTQIPDDKITLLVLDAVTTRAKSLASAKNVLRRVNGLIQFYLDARNESSVTHTGESSLVLIRDYIESLSERGRTAPAAGKHALTVWADAIGIDWPLTNPLVLSASVVETSEEPKQAPAMELSTVKAIDALSDNPEVSVYKRAFAAGLLLMAYASLRFADVQRLRTFEVNIDSAHGTLLSSKTKKQHGQHCPWACPRQGLTGSRDWVRPILDLRTAYRKVNGLDMSYTYPRINHL